MWVVQASQLRQQANTPMAMVAPSGRGAMLVDRDSGLLQWLQPSGVDLAAFICGSCSPTCLSELVLPHLMTQRCFFPCTHLRACICWFHLGGDTNTLKQRRFSTSFNALLPKAKACTTPNLAVKPATQAVHSYAQNGIQHAARLLQNICKIPLQLGPCACAVGGTVQDIAHADSGHGCMSGLSQSWSLQ